MRNYERDIHEHLKIRTLPEAEFSSDLGDRSDQVHPGRQIVTLRSLVGDRSTSGCPVLFGSGSLSAALFQHRCDASRWCLGGGVRRIHRVDSRLLSE